MYTTASFNLSCSPVGCQIGFRGFTEIKKHRLAFYRDAISSVSSPAFGSIFCPIIGKNGIKEAWAYWTGLTGGGLSCSMLMGAPV